MGENKNISWSVGFRWECLKERDHFQDQSVAGMIYIYTDLDGRGWNGVYFSTLAQDRVEYTLFWTGQWNCEIHKKRGIFWLPDELLNTKHLNTIPAVHLHCSFVTSLPIFNCNRTSKNYWYTALATKYILAHCTWYKSSFGTLHLKQKIFWHTAHET